MQDKLVHHVVCSFTSLKAFQRKIKNSDRFYVLADELDPEEYKKYENLSEKIDFRGNEKILFRVRVFEVRSFIVQLPPAQTYTFAEASREARLTGAKIWRSVE